MNIPSVQQETIVNYARADDYAEVYTTDTTVMTKLDKLVAKQPQDWKLVKEDKDKLDGDVVAKTYRCNKRLISYRSSTASRNLTEEQRRASAERLKEARNREKT